MLTKTQQVVQSCRLIQNEMPFFSEKEIVARFIYEWFHTTDEYVYKAVGRRLEELWKDWKIIQKVWDLYKVTALWMDCVLEDIHLKAVVFIGKKEILYPRVKKVKSDRKPHKILAESEAKKLSKEINEWLDQLYGVNTETINTNKWTPKHSLREHIKSLFF